MDIIKSLFNFFGGVSIYIISVAILIIPISCVVLDIINKHFERKSKEK